MICLGSNRILLNIAGFNAVISSNNIFFAVSSKFANVRLIFKFKKFKNTFKNDKKIKEEKKQNKILSNIKIFLYQSKIIEMH